MGGEVEQNGDDAHDFVPILSKMADPLPNWRSRLSKDDWMPPLVAMGVVLEPGEITEPATGSDSSTGLRYLHPVSESSSSDRRLVTDKSRGCSTTPMPPPRTPEATPVDGREVGTAAARHENGNKGVMKPRAAAAEYMDAASAAAGGKPSGPEGVMNIDVDGIGGTNCAAAAAAASVAGTVKLLAVCDR